MQHNEFLKKAAKLSIDNVDKGGGPFGALIVKDGKIIATGVNKVIINNDPTAHAEIEAIREAASKLGTHNLEGCTIYTSCEPCPMCLAAIYWAHIDKIYFANTKNDAKLIGFDDSHIYEQFKLTPEEREIPTKQVFCEEAMIAFNKWKEKEDKIQY